MYIYIYIYIYYIYIYIYIYYIYIYYIYIIYKVIGNVNKYVCQTFASPTVTGILTL